jgi:hypothetical protein
MDTGARNMTAKALRLFFRLNADAMLYTPLSEKGLRAARLMPLIRAKYL